MFDIGFGEMMLLAAIALIAIGPKQLPEVARTVGRLLNELRRATGDLTKTMTDARDSANTAILDVHKTVIDTVASLEEKKPGTPELENKFTHAAASAPRPVAPGASEEQLTFGLHDASHDKKDS